MPRHLQSQSYSTGPAAIASSCFTARCDSIWYGFFIATLLFSAKENSLSAYQDWERGVATFYDLTGIPASMGHIMFGQTLIHNGLEQYGLLLIPHESSAFPAAFSRLTGKPIDQSISSLLPYSVIVDHIGKKPFVSIMVRYDLTSVSGESIFYNNIQ